jgi:cellobiose phosphorylase
VGQRSGERRGRRSGVPARRRQRALLVGDAAASAWQFPYVTRHGFGYTVFEHEEGGIRTELWIYVARDAAIKFSSLKVRNASGRPRRSR